MSTSTSGTSTSTSANAAPPISNPAIHDDKSPHCIPFILSLLKNHQATQSANGTSIPFIIGLNGIQGSGKTTLVSTLSSLLHESTSLPTLVLSIDDLYLTHADQVALASSHPENPLIQHRGEPGTHDIPLLTSLFTSLKAGLETKIPSYDKSAFNGSGDRLPPSQWKTVNAPSSPKIRIIILEGWCVGFRSLPPSQIMTRKNLPSKTLSHHRLSDLLFINAKLDEYEVLNGLWDAFIHIDAEETEYVYEWRQEQEEVLRREKGEGRGMSREQVERFVDGYYPAYEFYIDALREGVFKGKEGGEGRQLRLVVGRDRGVKKVIRI